MKCNTNLHSIPQTNFLHLDTCYKVLNLQTRLTFSFSFDLVLVPGACHIIVFHLSRPIERHFWFVNLLLTIKCNPRCRQALSLGHDETFITRTVFEATLMLVSSQLWQYPVIPTSCALRCSVWGVRRVVVFCFDFFILHHQIRLLSSDSRVLKLERSLHLCSRGIFQFPLGRTGISLLQLWIVRVLSGKCYRDKV